MKRVISFLLIGTLSAVSFSAYAGWYCVAKNDRNNGSWYGTSSVKGDAKTIALTACSNALRTANAGNCHIVSCTPQP